MKRVNKTLILYVLMQFITACSSTSWEIPATANLERASWHADQASRRVTEFRQQLEPTIQQQSFANRMPQSCITIPLGNGMTRTNCN